ncbi:MAG: SpoIIE family protein phosphatase [Desulfurivibrio sp.]|nr:SpoIIE family protein phosphatase [Desulfurivibrio sp.]
MNQLADLPNHHDLGALLGDDQTLPSYSAEQILGALNDGVYVTDRQRRIVYWNQAAEQISGWSAAEVIGKSCFDEILSHTDKDGHLLCGREHCPLQRAMTTGSCSTSPSLVFLLHKDSRRIPVQVNVSPIFDDEGQVIGGVEIFRDCSEEIRDLERARRIQNLSMQLPEDDNPRLQFAARYLPFGMLGGDYYTVERLDDKRYAFCIADVMGHGTAAGLYAMHLHSLWENNRRFIDRPATFASAINRSLCALVRDEESFATGLFGVIDLQAEAIALCAAGSPSFILHRQGRSRQIKLSSLPLGMVEDHVYEVTFLPIEPGDGLLFYTDGAIEIGGADNQEMLGNQGLIKLIDHYGFPYKQTTLGFLIEKMLRFSNQVRFGDDVTMLALHYRGAG